MLRKAYLIMPLHWLFNYPCFEITLSNMYKYIDMMKLLSLKEDHALQCSMIWILYWIVGWLLHINVCMHSPRKTFAQTYVLEMQFLAKALYMNSVYIQSIWPSTRQLTVDDVIARLGTDFFSAIKKSCKDREVCAVTG